MFFFFKQKRSIATRITKNNNNKKSTCCLVAVNPLNINHFFNDELCQKLLTNGNKLADDLNLKFITATTQFYNQSKKIIFIFLSLSDESIHYHYFRKRYKNRK